MRKPTCRRGGLAGPRESQQPQVGVSLMDISPWFKGLFFIFLIALILPLFPGQLYAQTPGPEVSQAGPLGYDEAEAYAIDGMIMCPVCPAETIDQAQVPLARQMRQIVREMLAEGATRQEILDFFAQRYGQDILASPPKSGFNLVAWILPLVGVPLVLAAGVLVLRSMSARRVPQTAGGPQIDQDLQPYLEMVDEQLALSQSPDRPDTSDSSASDVEPQGEARPDQHG